MATTDFNGLPPAGALQDADVVPLQRGVGAGSTQRTTLAAIAAAALAKLVQGSGIRISGSTISSGGADIVKITGSTTLGLQHLNRWLECDSASAMTLTIPAQADVAWPDSIQLEGDQWGAGAVTIVGAAGVTIRRSSKITATTDGQDSVWGLKRKGLNTWLLFGQMGAA